MEPQPRIIEKTVTVKPHKVGKRKVSWASSTVDHQLADEVKETATTKTYVKHTYEPTKDYRPSAPPTESLYPDLYNTTLPSMQVPVQPVAPIPPPLPTQRVIPVRKSRVIVSVPRTSECHAIVILALVLLFAGYALGFSTTETTMKVVDAGWNFQAWVEELKDVEKSGWSLPAGATVLSVVPSVYAIQDVLTHTERVCEAGTRVDQIHDGYDTMCSESLVRYDEWEEYSHTEKTCYDNGHCIEEDVYKKSSEPVYETVCTEKPRYRAVNTPVTECYEKPVYRKDLVYADYYRYMTKDWVSTKVELNSATNTLEETHNPGPNRRYTHVYINYWLRLEDARTFNVEAETYNKYMQNKNAMALVTKHWFGLWTTIKLL
jgi:hypothetical protein